MGIFKGWFGEKKTTFNMWLSLDSNLYRRYHNVIIPCHNGTAQIDHLLISPFGLFIVETKNKKGWIFGSQNQKKWTQSIFGKNYNFQNPLHQVYRQKKVLSDYLELPQSKIHTVIFFNGDCNFKTPLPRNVIKSRLGRYIKQFKKQKLTNDELNEVIRLIEHSTDLSISKRDHLRSLRERHNSSTNCPKCGSELVERIARKGPNTGSKFLGCSNYPNCKFTRSL